MDRRCLLLGVLCGPMCLPAAAMTVEDLRARIAAGNPPTLIDIRSEVRYTQGHIQGAINIPAAIIAAKGLPPLGEVVVYGDGADAGPVREAVAALAAKPGIEPEGLDGGLAAWEATLPEQTTRTTGLHPEALPRIQAADLKRLIAEEPDLLLVDLRGWSGRRGAGRGAAAAAADPDSASHRGGGGVVAAEALGAPIDLAAYFPGVAIVKPDPRGDASPGGSSAAGTAASERLRVLIDDGNGIADQVARRLRASGVQRVLILSGGEYGLRGGAQTRSQTTDVKGGGQ